MAWLLYTKKHSATHSRTEQIYLSSQTGTRSYGYEGIRSFSTSCSEHFQITNNFINTQAYKLLARCHDALIACDEQITPQYSLRSTYLATSMKSFTIVESETLYLRSLQTHKSVIVMLLHLFIFFLSHSLLFLFFHLWYLLSPFSFVYLFLSAPNTRSQQLMSGLPCSEGGKARLSHYACQRF